MRTRIVLLACGFVVVMTAWALLVSSTAQARETVLGEGLQPVVLASQEAAAIRRCLVEVGGARQTVSTLPGFVMLPTSAATARITCEGQDGRRAERDLHYRPPLGWPVFVWIAFDDGVTAPHSR